jgi:hypothetical protein
LDLFSLNLQKFKCIKLWTITCSPDANTIAHLIGILILSPWSWKSDNLMLIINLMLFLHNILNIFYIDFVIRWATSREYYERCWQARQKFNDSNNVNNISKQQLKSTSWYFVALKPQSYSKLGEFYLFHIILLQLYTDHSNIILCIALLMTASDM